MTLEDDKTSVLSEQSNIVSYSGRDFTIFHEKELNWMKFPELARYKKRAFAPELIEEDEQEIAEKETKKMFSCLTASIK